MSTRDRRGGRVGVAVLTSAVVHAGAVGLFWAGATRATELPAMRVYSVSIVSPPPQEFGPPTPATGDVAPVEPTPEPVPPAPQPEPQPVAETPPAPAPKPTPPKPAPPKESKPAPPKPKPAPPKESKPAPKKPEPEKPTPPRETKPAAPKPAPPKPEPPKPTPARSGSAAEEAGPPAPSRGAKPSASAAAGDGLNVRIEGVEFSDPAYLQNIIRQINRRFRPPAGSRTDVVEVVFWINRNGSVADIEVGRSSAAFAFRVAAMEAVEQAGIDRAFGPLPDSYPADRLPVSFEFRPAR